jgi:hypothetical protein
MSCPPSWPDEVRARLRRDVEAYRRTPQTPAESALADLADLAGLQDDEDWESLYAAAELE